MSSYTQLTYHIVFSTKYRKPQIVETFRERLDEYTGGIIRSNKGCQLEIGGVADHVHVLAQLSPSIAVSDVVRNIKANSSKWIHENPEGLSSFAWQKGYGAFTVSYSNIEFVREYIRKQPEHHQTKTFREEYIQFLRSHNIEFRSEYLFEDEHHG